MAPFPSISLGAERRLEPTAVARRSFDSARPWPLRGPATAGTEPATCVRPVVLQGNRLVSRERSGSAAFAVGDNWMTGGYCVAADDSERERKRHHKRPHLARFLSPAQEATYVCYHCQIVASRGGRRRRFVAGVPLPLFHFNCSEPAQFGISAAACPRRRPVRGTGFEFGLKIMDECRPKQEARRDAIRISRQGIHQIGPWPAPWRPRPSARQRDPKMNFPRARRYCCAARRTPPATAYRGRRPADAAPQGFSRGRQRRCDPAQGAPARCLQARHHAADQQTVCLARGVPALLLRQSARRPAASRQHRAPRRSIASCIRRCRPDLRQARTAAVHACRHAALCLLRRAEQDARPGSGFPDGASHRNHRAQYRAAARRCVRGFRPRPDRLCVAGLRLPSPTEDRRSAWR